MKLCLLPLTFGDVGTDTGMEFTTLICLSLQGSISSFPCKSERVVLLWTICYGLVPLIFVYLKYLIWTLFESRELHSNYKSGLAKFIRTLMF